MWTPLTLRYSKQYITGYCQHSHCLVWTVLIRVWFGGNGYGREWGWVFRNRTVAYGIEMGIWHQHVSHFTNHNVGYTFREWEWPCVNASDPRTPLIIIHSNSFQKAILVFTVQNSIHLNVQNYATGRTKFHEFATMKDSHLPLGVYIAMSYVSNKCECAMHQELDSR